MKGARITLSFNAEFSGTIKNNTKQTAQLESLPFTLTGIDREEAAKGSDKQELTSCFIKADKLLIVLGREQTVSSFYLLPDQSKDNKGLISNYELRAGNDPSNIDRLIKTGEFSNIENNPILQSVFFTPVKARYIELKATRMIKPGEPIGFTEISIQ